MAHIRKALAKYALPLGAAGAAALAPAMATAAPATFASPVEYPLGFGTVGASQQPGVADFDGDGKIDVVIGAYDTNDFELFPGNGDGTLGTGILVQPIDPATGAARPRRATVADVNADGKPDIVFAGYGLNDNIIVLNQSSSGVFNFTTPTAPALLPAPQAPSVTAVGDLNGDTHLDLVQVGYNGGSCSNDLSVLRRLGNGNGTFGSSSSVFTDNTAFACEGSQGAAVADVNGDGHADVIATSNKTPNTSPLSTPSVLIGLGDGTGSVSQPALQVPIGTNNAGTKVVVTDVSGDGHLDLVIPTGSDGLSTMLGNGNGTFGTPIINASVVGYDASVADLNGDGFKDVVVATYGGDSVKLALGNGDGTFGTATTIASTAANSHPYGIGLADLNGDGLKDVVVASYGTYGMANSPKKVYVLINTTAVSAPAVSAVTPSTGSTAGGTSVTITGTDLAGATAVTFGGVAAASFTVNSATSITAVSPAHAAGTVAIAVTTAGGTGTGAGLFTYETPVTPATPATPTEAVPSASSAGNAPGTRKAALPALFARGQRPRMVSGRIVTRGTVPAEATRVVQRAVRGATRTEHVLFGLDSAASVEVPCAITASGNARRFACSVRLGGGRWTITTSALAGNRIIASSVSRLSVRATRIPVTG